MYTAKIVGERGFQNRMPIPKNVRTAVMKRADGYCESCGFKTSCLELHHITYYINKTWKEPWGELIFGKETERELLALCRECHHAKHIHPYTKEFYLNPEELQDELSYLAHVASKD